MPESLLIAALAGIVVVSLAALAAGWNQIDDFLKRRAGKDADRTVGPQPFLVKGADEFVQKKDFELHVSANTQRHGQLFAQIEKAREEARQELKEATGDLHVKVNKVDREVGGIAASIELQNQQLARIETSLMHNPNRRAA